eukprot:6187381-Pleurochrysis_carterae.AAC.2
MAVPTRSPHQGPSRKRRAPPATEGAVRAEAAAAVRGEESDSNLGTTVLRFRSKLSSTALLRLLDSN